MGSDAGSSRARSSRPMKTWTVNFPRALAGLEVEHRSRRIRRPQRFPFPANVVDPPVHPFGEIADRIRHSTHEELVVHKVEGAAEGGQVGGWELTGAAGLSKEGSHGQAPHLQQRIKA